MISTWYWLLSLACTCVHTFAHILVDKDIKGIYHTWRKEGGARKTFQSVCYFCKKYFRQTCLPVPLLPPYLHPRGILPLVSSFSWTLSAPTSSPSTFPCVPRNTPSAQGPTVATLSTWVVIFTTLLVSCYALSRLHMSSSYSTPLAEALPPLPTPFTGDSVSWYRPRIPLVLSSLSLQPHSLSSCSLLAGALSPTHLYSLGPSLFLSLDSVFLSLSHSPSQPFLLACPHSFLSPHWPAEASSTRTPIATTFI